MPRRLRRRGAFVAMAVVTSITTACSSGRPSTEPKPVAVQPNLPGPPAAGTQWASVLAHIGSEGTVTTSTALQAFQLAIGPTPGERESTGPIGTLADGTVGARWVAGHWSALTAAQQAAVGTELIAPARVAATSSPGAAAAVFLAAAERAEAAITAQLGRGPGQDIEVVLKPTQRTGTSDFAYTMSFDANWGFAGAPAHCVVFVNPILSDLADSAETVSVMDHQVFHCFQADDYASLYDYGQAPSWLIEGSAEWVGDDLQPVTDLWWQPYLTEIGTSVMQRSYDAVGFFAHMDETGSSPWKLVDPMLTAGTGAAAFDMAADPAFLDTWASSLARQPFGPDWEATGPGIVDASYRPSIDVLGDGSVNRKTVAAYTNAVIPVDVAADVVQVTVSTPYGRLHAADGNEFSGDHLSQAEFCVTSTCAACPDLASLSRLPAGPAWFALTGGSAGATYSISGVTADCAACPVGTWTATSYSYSNPGDETALSYSGGSGVEIQIHSDGSMSVDYAAMSPLAITESSPVHSKGTGSFSGRQTGLLPLPRSEVTPSGYFDPPTGEVTLGYQITSPTRQKTTAVRTNPFGTGQLTWTCSGSTMTFATAAGTGSQALRWVLARKP